MPIPIPKFKVGGLGSDIDIFRAASHGPVARPVTHENVRGRDRDRDRADVRFDPDPDIGGYCSIFGTGWGEIRCCAAADFLLEPPALRE